MYCKFLMLCLFIRSIYLGKDFIYSILLFIFDAKMLSVGIVYNCTDVICVYLLITNIFMYVFVKLLG